MNEMLPLFNGVLWKDSEDKLWKYINGDTIPVKCGFKVTHIYSDNHYIFASGNNEIGMIAYKSGDYVKSIIDDKIHLNRINSVIIKKDVIEIYVWICAKHSLAIPTGIKELKRNLDPEFMLILENNGTLSYFELMNLDSKIITLAYNIDKVEIYKNKIATLDKNGILKIEENIIDTDVIYFYGESDSEIVYTKNNGDLISYNNGIKECLRKMVLCGTKEYHLDEMPGQSLINHN